MGDNIINLVLRSIVKVVCLDAITLLGLFAAPGVTGVNGNSETGRLDETGAWITLH